MTSFGLGMPMQIIGGACCAAQEYEFDLTVKEGEEAGAEEGAAEPMEQD